MMPNTLALSYKIYFKYFDDRGSPFLMIPLAWLPLVLNVILCSPKMKNSSFLLCSCNILFNTTTVLSCIARLLVNSIGVFMGPVAPPICLVFIKGDLVKRQSNNLKYIIVLLLVSLG